MNDKYTTDHEMIARIKQSLENYEETYLPGSWESFLQRRKQHNRRILLRFVTAAAACLLLGYLGFLAIPTGKRELQPSLAHQPVDAASRPITQESPVQKTPSVLLAKNHSGSIKVASPGKGSKTATTPKTVSAPNAVHQGNSAATSDASPAVTEKVTAFNPSSEIATAVANQDTSGKTTYIPKAEISAASKAQPTSAPEQNMASVTGHKIRFGINFSPVVTSSQSSGSMNFMGGVSADISLTSKLALSTGLQVENQNLVKSLPGIVSSSSFPQSQTKTKLINLDVPINLTWKFAAEKSHAYYVSAGLSSLVYLRQENKNTTYSQDLTPVSSVINGVEVKTYSVADQISITQDRVSPTQTFDFAGRINFMVGFEKKLSDKLFIHFEPYTKIPTSGQSAGSFNHTTTGINFKISF